MRRTSRAAAGIIGGVSIVLFLLASFGQAGEDPFIGQSFAVQELVSGETWKIYLKASSPAADMKYIYAVVEQKGGTNYPVSLTRIREMNKREISGYVYLNTFNDEGGRNWYTLNLTLQIQDEKGRFSNAVTFPLSFKWRAEKKDPPAGVFEEKELGPIMIRLSQRYDSGDSSYSAD
jgi:hypothetical protein